MRYRPSTGSASFDSAWRLSRVCAFAVAARIRRRIRRPSLAVTASAASSVAETMSCSEMCAYQTSIVDIRAKRAIAVRYVSTLAVVAARVSDFENSLFRPAMVMLAASRLTSYSNGPGRVSSKSFTSNTRLRSGDPNAPKFDRCASPQSWTLIPASGVRERSAAMTFAAPR